MREVVDRLVRDDTRTGLHEETILPYLHDVHDRVLGAAETVDSARDQVGGVLETNLGEQDNELNIITRKLAAWAAIIAVPTAVTGFYGQNVPYPASPNRRVRQRGADHFRGRRTAHADAPPRLAVTDRPARNVDTAPIDGDIRP